MDEAIILVFRAPHSYTREDTVEFQCHGGRMAPARLLKALQAAGARPATPGEFTRRAFLNGRIDLTQAEAVMDLIRASSDRAADAALEQMRGGISLVLNDTTDRLATLCAHIEALLDFPDDDIPNIPWPAFNRTCSESLAVFESLLKTWGEGHLLREGARIVISGRPNAGKSSIMNALLSYERAIVSPSPGTTRDTIEESFIYDGIPMRLIDTAGLRDSACPIEAEGVKRAKAALSTADAILYVIDMSCIMTNDDVSMISDAPVAPIIVLNKADLPKVADISSLTDSGYRTVGVSCVDRSGIMELLSALASDLHKRFGFGDEAPSHATISERHRQHLINAKDALTNAFDLIASRENVLVEIAHYLHQCIHSLSLLTGKAYNESIIDRIFSSFCIGK